MQYKSSESRDHFNRRFERKGTNQAHKKRNITLIATGVFMILLLAAGTVVAILRLFQ